MFFTLFFPRGNNMTGAACFYRHICVICHTQVWERRRRIPSTTYNDPLDHIFTEFDEDGDGHLTAEEISKALRSRGVEATPDQVQLYIQGGSLQDCCSPVDSLGAHLWWFALVMVQRIIPTRPTPPVVVYHSHHSLPVAAGRWLTEGHGAAATSWCCCHFMVLLPLAVALILLCCSCRTPSAVFQ